MSTQRNYSQRPTKKMPNTFDDVHHKQPSKFKKWWIARPKFSYIVYTITAILILMFTTVLLWWSTQSEVPYSHSRGPLLFQILTHTGEALHTRVSCFNLLVLCIIYSICVTIINRFWIGTAVFVTFVTIFAVATKIKIEMRQEPIIPSDLGFLSGSDGGAGEITSFITDESKHLITSALILLLIFIIICVTLQFIDKRKPFIYCSWRHPLASRKNFWGLICRVITPLISAGLLVSYTMALTTPTSLLRKVLDRFGYLPRLWSIEEDATHNGSLNTFLSLIHTKIMDDEPSYSQETMATIYKRYEKVAQNINQKRAQNLSDSTIVMILSESFSDPTRVPGVTFNTDPMPNLRKLSKTNTSGLMLSPGYGGGTANVEFQQMTGLSMVNFSPTMLSPYQQLVPNTNNLYSFNQIWNEHCGEKYSTSCSIGYHPYLQFFYLRNINYRKFGFSHFYTRDSDPQIKHGQQYTGPNGRVTHVSDEEAYKNVVEEIQSNTKANKPSQYIQLITMQNHAPYTDIYGDTNEFVQANTSENMPNSEIELIDTYTKGVQRTDTATIHFLKQLDAIEKPITVVFYGDHLPGIYSTAISDAHNNLRLHETNYFIWSNVASTKSSKKLSDSNAAYTSSNYFMAQAAEQMNARVSPYLALLDALHNRVPAMSRNGETNGAWTVSGAPTYLNDKGEVMNPAALSSETKQMLDDYRMVQYDMTAGKNYLRNMGFMEIP